jgi:hypothetical protein
MQHANLVQEFFSVSASDFFFLVFQVLISDFRRATSFGYPLKATTTIPVIQSSDDQSIYLKGQKK